MTQAAPVEVLPCDRSAAEAYHEASTERLLTRGETMEDLALAFARHRQTHSTHLAVGGIIDLAGRLCDDFAAREIAGQTEAPSFADSDDEVRDYWLAIARAALLAREAGS